MRAPERIAGRAVLRAERAPGGDINEALAVELEGGVRAFVKGREGAGPGEFAAEAEGLRWLGAPGGLRTPEVIDVDDDWLALAWIDSGRLDATGEEELGRGLAITHAAGADAFGAGSSLRFGKLLFPNEPRGTFAAFYGENRLAPLIRSAGLSAEGMAAVNSVIERIDALAGPPEPPARVHGDLWSGNVLADSDGRPWLIDPVAHGGHREVDLAMLSLFGTPAERTMSAYAEVAPLADGWEERVPLWQLFPLLVHAALFGAGYADRAEAIATAL